MKSAFLAITTATLAFFSTNTAQADFLSQVYKQPKINGVHLDWCLNWGTDCGKPAADAFCETKTAGLSGSKSFEIWENLGRQTKVFNSGQICDDPSCDSFKFIECGSAADRQEESQNTAPAGNWVSIAADGNGDAGLGTAGTSAQARKFAMNFCKQSSSGGKCKVLMTEEAKCAAYSDAKNDDGGFWYYVAYAGSKKEAEKLAYKFCRDNPEAKAYCEVKLSGCN
jgi:hypothetical protein